MTPDMTGQMVMELLGACVVVIAIIVVLELLKAVYKKFQSIKEERERRNRWENEEILSNVMCLKGMTCTYAGCIYTKVRHVDWCVGNKCPADGLKIRFVTEKVAMDFFDKELSTEVNTENTEDVGEERHQD